MLTVHDPSGEASRGGQLHWREQADGQWVAAFPIGSGHYEIAPETRGYRIVKHETGKRPVGLGRRDTLGGAMAAAKDDFDQQEQPQAADGRDCGCPHAHPPGVPTTPCAGEEGGWHHSTKGGVDRWTWEPEIGVLYMVTKMYVTHYKRGRRAGQDVEYEVEAAALGQRRRKVIGRAEKTLAEAKALAKLDYEERVRPSLRDSSVANDSAPYARNERDPHDVEEGRKLGVLDDPRKLYDALHERLSKESQEVFLVIPLDLRGQALCGPVEVARGQRDQVEVDPSDIYRPVIRHNAKLFVVVHCHPSGHAKPSPADRSLTAALRKGAPVALGAKGGKFADHVIIAASATRGEYYSFGEDRIHTVRHR